ncbi:MAG: sortase [Chloroflexota bacterium]|nr:sortase [Chloroflexota bacterium]
MSEKSAIAGRRIRDSFAAIRVPVMAAFLLFFAAGCFSRPAVVPDATPTVARPPAQLPAPGTTLTATPETAATVPAPTSTPSGSITLPDDAPPLSGAPDRVVIPAIDLDTAIVDVGWTVVERGDERFTEWETAEDAAARHINSARPGQQGNVVLSGHHNTRGEVFRRISDLEIEPGDYIYLYDDEGQRHTYLVDEVTDPPLLEVGADSDQRLENARYILPTNDARVTLVTCWPYWTNTHRVVVVGKLVAQEN